MCTPSLAEIALTRGTLRGLAGMRSGPLDGVKPSELVVRMNMMQFITADGIIRWVTLELKG